MTSGMLGSQRGLPLAASELQFAVNFRSTFPDDETKARINMH